MISNLLRYLQPTSWSKPPAPIISSMADISTNVADTSNTGAEGDNVVVAPADLILESEEVAEEGNAEAESDNSDAEDDDAEVEVITSSPEPNDTEQTRGGKGKEHAKVGFKFAPSAQTARKGPPVKQAKHHPDRLDAEGRMRAEIPTQMAELRDQVCAEIGKYLEFVKQQPGTNVSNVGLVRSVVRKVEVAIAKKGNDEAFLSDLPTHAEVLAIRYCSPTGHTVPEKVGGGLAYLGKADLLQVGPVRSNSNVAVSNNSPADPLIAAAVDGLATKVKEMQETLKQQEKFRNTVTESLNKKTEKLRELRNLYGDIAHTAAGLVSSTQKHTDQLDKLRTKSEKTNEQISKLGARLDKLPSQGTSQSSPTGRQPLHVDTAVSTAKSSTSAGTQPSSASAGPRKRQGSTTSAPAKRAKPTRKLATPRRSSASQPSEPDAPVLLVDSD